MNNGFTTKSRRVHARREDVSVNITISVGVANRVLTRDEHRHLIDTATSQVMEVVAGLPHVHVPLSRLKVSR